MTAKQAASRQGFASKSELELRNAMEDLMRQMMPDARIVHEIVMGDGKVRADIAAIGLDTIQAVEVKGAYDDTTRLLHQVGMFQLCVPSVWMVVSADHDYDAKLIRHLLPSVGLIIGTNMDKQTWSKNQDPVKLEIFAEPKPMQPIPDMMTRLLWRDEMFNVCQRHNLGATSKSTRPTMKGKLLEFLDTETLQKEICQELRGREALWRADKAIRII